MTLFWQENKTKSNVITTDKVIVRDFLLNSLLSVIFNSSFSIYAKVAIILLNTHFLLDLDKFGCASTIKASFMVFGFHQFSVIYCS